MTHILYKLFVLCIICVHFELAVSSYLSEVNKIEDHNYWFKNANEHLKRAEKVEKNTGLAKNVIIFIGDGMGLSTITASRIYDKTERGYLIFEDFPNIGSIKTYSANKIVSDSCSTATAMFCGIKGNHKTAGVDSTVAENDCPASLASSAQLESIFDWAIASNKRTGFVTTTRVTHATPSALYSHIANRKWECEATMPADAASCKDIAKQLIQDEPGKSINVIMGGGRQCLQTLGNNTREPIDTWGCVSRDGRDLIADWISKKNKSGVSNKFVSNTEELASVNGEDFVLGIFANGHLSNEHARDKGPKGMPSLTAMTESAIKLLQKGDSGFILMVEGGLIDMAHHRGHAKIAMDETKSFNNAIAAAIKLMAEKAEETLIIVSSDHSHPLVIAGYADRGTPITGIAGKSKIDGVPYTTLLYGSGGPDSYQYYSKNNTVVRPDPTLNNTDDWNYAQQAPVLTDEVTHDGTDVLVYAKGPMSHLFHTVHEQTYIAHVIGYAAKIGPYKDSTRDTNKSNKNSAQGHVVLILSLFILYAHRKQQGN